MVPCCEGQERVDVHGERANSALTRRDTKAGEEGAAPKGRPESFIRNRSTGGSGHPQGGVGHLATTDEARMTCNDRRHAPYL